MIQFHILIDLAEVGSSGSDAGTFFGIVFLLLLVGITLLFMIYKFQRKWLGKVVPEKIDQLHEFFSNLKLSISRSYETNGNLRTAQTDIERSKGEVYLGKNYNC